MKHVQKNPVNPLIGLIMVLAMALIFSCSGDSNESPPDQSVSSSSGGGGAKVSSSSGEGGSSSSEVGSSSSEALGSSSSGGEEPSVSSSSGGDPSSSSLGGPSSSSILSSSSVHVHIWGEWVTITHETCAADGKRTRTCIDDGTVQEEVIPKTPYNTATQFCKSGTNVVRDLCGTATYTASQFCDHRDDKIYKKVTINTQTWMAENLNYDADGSRCYDDGTGGDSQNRCGTYGRLYNWETAMAGAASSSANPSGVQGVCPSGWHLPSDAEWTALTTFVGGTGTAGKKLKAVDGWDSYAGITNEDAHGFAALPGGYSGNGTSFSYVGGIGRWWSSTQYTGSIAYLRNMYYNSEDVSRSYNDSSNLYSVRCAQD